MKTEETPKSLLEAIVFFADEQRAHDALVAMRWPNGVRCVHCGSENIGKLVVSTIKGNQDKDGKPKPDKTRRVWNCKSCKKQFTAKLGSIFAESPLPLSKWLPAVWQIVNAKNGISSHELARALDITQKSAWFMAHRIRTMIQRGGGIVRLDGVVEVDETFIGGLARNMHADKRAKKIKGTGGAGKTAVMGLMERHSAGKRASRVVARVVPNVRREVLVGEIRKYVLAGSEIQSDAWCGYNNMPSDFTHKVVDHAEAYVQDGVHTNGLENFWSLLKRGIKGTYVSVEPFHLFRYLGEQVFRFNERKDKEGDKGRFLKVIANVFGKRLTWAKLTATPC